MDNHYIPQPRYSKEHKDKAADSEVPLFTLDLYWYPTKRRHTSTGVITAETAAHIIDMVQRAAAKEEE